MRIELLNSREKRTNHIIQRLKFSVFLVLLETK